MNENGSKLIKLNEVDDKFGINVIWGICCCFKT